MLVFQDYQLKRCIPDSEKAAVRDGIMEQIKQEKDRQDVNAGNYHRHNSYDDQTKFNNMYNNYKVFNYYPVMCG